MARPPKFDRPVPIEEAQECSQRLAKLKKMVHNIGDPEHKKIQTMILTVYRLIIISAGRPVATR
jgi:hypothetical protein